jgi:hypothetical protein
MSSLTMRGQASSSDNLPINKAFGACNFPEIFRLILPLPSHFRT